MNEKNLKPVQTESEAREKGKAGGIKSGAVRRKKRTLQEAARWIIDLPLSKDDGTRSVLTGEGITDERDMTQTTAIIIAIVRKAKNGDIKAAAFLRDTLGDSAAQQLEERRFEVEDPSKDSVVDDWINSIPGDDN